MLPHADVNGGHIKGFRYGQRSLGVDDLSVVHEGRLRKVTRPCKHEVTLRYVPFDNIWGMAEWRDMKQPHERLRWARMHWQEAKGITPDAGAAAESMGIKPHTYRAYERPPGASKHTELNDQRAIQFGRKFGVNWIWLLTGEGSPDATDQLTPTERRVIDALREAPEARQAAAADAIVQLLKSA